MRSLPYHLAMLAFESSQVIALRMMKLAGGGSQAGTEAARMVAEKVWAAQNAAVEAATGVPSVGIVKGYRTKVRANARRLRRST